MLGVFARQGGRRWGITTIGLVDDVHTFTRNLRFVPDFAAFNLMARV
jgi:hypothetical protein